MEFRLVVGSFSDCSVQRGETGVGQHEGKDWWAGQGAGGGGRGESGEM